MLSKKNIRFVHIPKCGGISIGQTIATNRMSKFTKWIKIVMIQFFFSYCFPFYINMSNRIDLLSLGPKLLRDMHSPYKILNKQNNNTQYFTIVRHPQKRLVSAYKMMLNGKCYFASQRVQSFFKRINYKSRTKNVPFDIFCRFLCSEEYINMPGSSSLYMLNQIDYITDENNNIVVPYEKLENIKSKDDMNDFFLKNNIDIKLAQNILHLNISREKKHWQTYYDEHPQVIDILKKHNMKDFIELEYEMYIPKSYMLQYES